MKGASGDRHEQRCDDKQNTDAAQHGNHSHSAAIKVPRRNQTEDNRHHERRLARLLIRNNSAVAYVLLT